MSAYSGRHRPAARRPRGRWRSVSRPILAGGLTLGLGVTALGYAAATDLPRANASYAASPAAAPADGVMLAGAARALLATQVSRADARTPLTAEQARAAADAKAKADAAAAAAKADAAAKAKADAARKAQEAAAAKAKADAERARQQAVASARANPQAAARALMAEHGWTSEAQHACLVTLWNGESDWRYTAENSSSGAYGIPQSLPASKMARFGADYRTNPLTQIKWGLWYIEQSYGSPCSALAFWQGNSPHWY
ncbi:MAG TPA: hypothetical protein VFJ94_16045 [Intrasporangium sp.]|uniref:aggregation-promoting factor C-terminal-like domain-containing protein n=1 Tax=Intrasporangium sp. TaxID=1925024 RepID=UPI002D79A2E9|nr:hypothetical protein [Intrasporangium sp.]HET7400028.1 hypothetical protein [Intrasporangium sp.]